MSASFWVNAPWRGGLAGHRMGLHPVSTDEWLADPITGDCRSDKQRLLADPTASVFAELPCSRPAQSMLLELVESIHRVRGDSTLPPLIAASLLVPDDLCIMTRAESSYRLTAASLCAPSYWHLADKIGRPLDYIHAPVPGLNERLGGLMTRFFSQLPPARVFERRNWLIHTSERLYHPEPKPWPRRGEAPTPSMLFVRSERQTLRRLDADHIVFTICVSCHPLADIAEHPDSAADLLTTIRSLDTDENLAMGTHYWAPSVVPFLEQISRGNAA